MTHKTEYTVRALAEFVCGLPVEEIPESSIRAAKRCLLDLLGAAAAAEGSPLARITGSAAGRLFSPGPSSVWFSGRLLNPAGAALVNSAMASALDLDDGHRAAGGHPGAGIIPAVLAVAQETGADGRETLAAMILGYEVAVRVAAARDFSALDTFSTGRWSAYGTAAAAARLYRLSPEKTAAAMAVSGVLSPGLSAAGYSAVMGNQAKEGIPWATLTGLCALELARDGFTGPTDILDHPAYYDRGRIVADLGKTFAIESVYFKPYSCCRWIHAALDALFQIMEENRLSGKEIQAMEVHTFERALRLNNYPDPDSLESAQYSIPFCLAAGAMEGREVLLPMDSGMLGRKDIVGLARKVSLHVDPALDILFPAQTPARIAVETALGRFQASCPTPLGDPGNPMDDMKLEEKFTRLSGSFLGAQEQRGLLSAIDRIHREGSLPLFSILGRKPSGLCNQDHRHGWTRINTD